MARAQKPKTGWWYGERVLLSQNPKVALLQMALLVIFIYKGVRVMASDPNQRASSTGHGVGSFTRPRRYQIRRDDRLVQVEPRNTGIRGLWAFALVDRPFVKAIMGEIEVACEYFWKRPIPGYFGCPEIEGISDEQVLERIRAFDEGENQAEAGNRKFPLQDLPFDRKRALIERIERIKSQHDFAWLD